MGFLLVILVFVFPLALPLVTLATLLFVAMTAEGGPRAFVLRALKAISVLVLIGGPGVVSGGSGSFLLPWWMHVAIGHSGVRYYVLQYAVLCVLLLLILLVVVTLWRSPVSQTSSRGRAPLSRRRPPPR